MKTLIKRVFPLILAVGTVSVTAQDTVLNCPAYVQTVVETARTACAGIGRSEVCYGSPALAVTARDNARVSFAKPGDKADLDAVQTLASGAFDPDSKTFGLAWLNIHANLPDKSVTMIAIGDVTLENLGSADSDVLALPVTVTYRTGANVRAEPNESAALTDVLNLGQVVTAVGRTADSSWMLVVIPGTTGWVASSLVRADFDLATLKVIAPGEGLMPPFASPMQAFKLRSTTGGIPCAEIPDSGVLAQTPEGTRDVFLEVNAQALTFTGTVFLQALTPADLIITTLEGKARYGYEDPFTEIPAGKQLLASYNGQEIVTTLSDYAFVRARYLPLQLLPREIKLEFSLGGVIFPFVPGTGFLNNIPAEGQCTVAWSVDVNLRAGPGMEYPIRRGISAGFYGRPDARAQGSDGQLWWRLADGIWVLAQNTAAAGQCADLPMIQPPPLSSQ